MQREKEQKEKRAREEAEELRMEREKREREETERIRKIREEEVLYVLSCICVVYTYNMYVYIAIDCTRKWIGNAVQMLSSSVRSRDKIACVRRALLPAGPGFELQSSVSLS